jgi:hypothetical protein
MKLANQSQNICAACMDLLVVAMEMAGQTDEERTRINIVNSMRGVAVAR